jgi:hypothetical protein
MSTIPGPTTPGSSGRSLHVDDNSYLLMILPPHHPGLVQHRWPGSCGSSINCSTWRRTKTGTKRLLRKIAKRSDSQVKGGRRTCTSALNNRSRSGPAVCTRATSLHRIANGFAASIRKLTPQVHLEPAIRSSMSVLRAVFEKLRGALLVGDGAEWAVVPVFGDGSWVMAVDSDDSVCAGDMMEKARETGMRRAWRCRAGEGVRVQTLGVERGRAHCQNETPFVSPPDRGGSWCKVSAGQSKAMEGEGTESVWR